MDKPLIVTRYKSIVDYLKLKGIVPEDVEVKTRVVEQEVEGRHVYGVLPYWLSSKCAQFTEVQLRIPESLRGKDLSMDEVEFYLLPMRTYRVEEVA